MKISQRPPYSARTHHFALPFPSSRRPVSCFVGVGERHDPLIPAKNRRGGKRQSIATTARSRRHGCSHIQTENWRRDTSLVPQRDRLVFNARKRLHHGKKAESTRLKKDPDRVSAITRVLAMSYELKKKCLICLICLHCLISV
jgi:hypothetical protein